MSNAERFTFQAEIQQLLQLMVHSLYTHKEVFLRELISNASDACDRLRFAALTDPHLLEKDEELAITVDVDKKARTITVRDNGIGMTRDEVVENIGTIARSGTRQFIEALSGNQAKDANLIGQFGVGFYSVFMVAEKVELTTRKAGTGITDGCRWESEGSGAYTLESVPKETHGTEVVLTIRNEEKEFLDAHRLRGIINRYSDHISLPIRMRRDGDEKQTEWESVNRGAPLWTRNKSEISEQEYNTFYNTLSYDSQPPLSVIHNRVEGKLEYTSLFFLPAHAPFDLWDREQRHGVKLYVRRIFIMDDARHLIPNYLRFVRGVVDSADLPLNVSREFLQHNREIDKINAGSVRKILAELNRIAEKEPGKYDTFWREFGRVFKEGIIEDPDNRDAIAKLLRFATSKEASPDQTISLATYVERMPLKQKSIYYLTAENHTVAKDSPHLEIFRKHDIEVLLLTDPVDEWVVAHLTEFDGKPLASIAKGELDLPELVEQRTEGESSPALEKLDAVVQKFKQVLGDRVKDVRLSHRLTDSPACLVADEHGIGGNLERILKSIGQEAPDYRPVLELNPTHPIITGLNADADDMEQWALVLFDQAALSEGAQIGEPASYVRRVNALLSRGFEKTAADRPAG